MFGPCVQLTSLTILFTVQSEVSHCELEPSCYKKGQKKSKTRNWFGNVLNDTKLILNEHELVGTFLPFLTARQL